MIKLCKDVGCTKLVCRCMQLAFKSDMLALRFYLALGAIFIGLGFLLPSTVFPDPNNIGLNARVTYLYMATIAPEWLWGTSFATQGVLMMWSLIANHTSRLLLWCDAVFGCVLWTTSIVSCFAVYWVGFENISAYKGPFIMGGEVSMALASWWIVVRYSFTEEKKSV